MRLFHSVFQMSTEKAPTTDKRAERLARLKELESRRVRIEKQSIFFFWLDFFRIKLENSMKMKLLEKIIEIIFQQIMNVVVNVWKDKKIKLNDDRKQRVLDLIMNVSNNSIGQQKIAINGKENARRKLPMLALMVSSTILIRREKNSIDDFIDSWPHLLSVDLL